MKKNILVLGIFLGLVFQLEAQTFDWLQLVYKGNNDYVIDVHTDDEGYIYASGRAKGFSEFGMVGEVGEGPTFWGGDHDAYASKYDPQGNLLWAKKAGGYESDWGYGITTDSEGSVYMTGVFRDTMFFGADTILAQNLDAGNCFVTKYDKDGNEQWMRFGASSVIKASRGQDIVVNSKDEVIVTGYVNDRVAFGTDTIGIEGFYAGYCSAYDKAGNLLWVTDFGEKGHGFDIVTNSSDELIVVGDIGNTQRGVMIQKLSPEGNVIWKKTGRIGGLDWSLGAKIQDDKSIYFSGVFEGDLEIDSVAIAVNNIGGFIGKMDMDGNIQSLTKTVECDSILEVTDIEIYDNNILIGGRFWKNLIIGNDTFPTRGGGDGFVACFDTLSNFKWLKQIGGNPTIDCGGKCSEGITVIVKDNDNNIFVGGFLKDSIMIDGNLFPGNLSTSGFLSKLYPPIESEISFSSSEICEEEEIAIEGTGYGSPLTYNWILPGGDSPDLTSSTTSVNYLSEGTFDIGLVISNSYSSDTVYLNSAILVNPLPEIDLGPDTTINMGTSITLDGGDGFDSYLWSNGSVTQTIEVDSSGVYSLSVMDANECSGYDEIEIIVVPPVSVDQEVLAKFAVFPNPTSGEINIENPFGDCNIEVYSITGKRVFASKLRKGRNNFNIDLPSSSLLTFKISNEQEVFTRGKLFFVSK